MMRVVESLHEHELGSSKNDSKEKLLYYKSDESQLCLLAICVHRCLLDIRLHCSDVPIQQIESMFSGVKFR